MIPGIVLGLMCGTAIGFVFGIYYTESSNRRFENESAVRRTLVEIELLRGELRRTLESIKN